MCTQYESKGTPETKGTIHEATIAWEAATAPAQCELVSVDGGSCTPVTGLLAIAGWLRRVNGSGGN